MMTLFTEAIKLCDGVLHNLSYHQARVNRTTEHFFGTRIDLLASLAGIPEYAQRGLYKCRVVYGAAIEHIEFIPYVFREVRSVALVAGEDIDYSYKYADRSQLNRLVENSGCDDIIIIRNGLVTDASASNLVFARGTSLVTPADCLLPGTKRRLLLDEGIVREITIRPQDIGQYDKVFFISAMIDLTDNISLETGRWFL